MDKDKLERAFNKAKLDLISNKNAVFISTIIFSLEHSWDESIPTLCTNGKLLRVNPEFFLNELDVKTRISALAHEAWHVAFRHILRLGNKDFGKYNEAADHVINLTLKEAGFEIPASWLCDDQYTGMSTEQVYDLLPAKPKEPNPQACDFEQGGGDSKQDINNMIIRANTIAGMKKGSDKQAGSMPGEVQIHIDSLINPKLKPEELFRNVLNTFDKSDYSYRRPNRRFMPEFYLPSLYAEALGEIAIAVDSSGSVMDHEFIAMCSEIDNFIRRVKPTRTTIASFDTSIQKIHKLAVGQSVSGLSFTGRGGTDLSCVFDHFNANKPNILVIFSDLECREILEEPTYPVIWICCNNPKGRVHFGTLIHYKA